MRSIAIIGALMLVAISGTAYGAVDSWCRYLPTNGGFCYTWNATATAYQGTNIKLDWSMILNPPAAYGGGTTIPVANVTNLGQSKTCSGTDKVKNLTINNTGIWLSCDTDVSGGTGGVTLPFQNVTGFNVSTFPMANISYPGAVNIPQANLTGLTLPFWNITNFNVSGLIIGTNVTWNGVSGIAQANLTGINAIPLGNLTGSSSGQCTGTEKVKNVTITDGTLAIVCDTDALGEAGSGSVFSIPWLYNVSTTGYFNDTFANTTYDARYKKLTEMTFPYGNITGTGLSAIPQANLSGITLPFSNITYFNVTSFPIANTTWNGLTGIAQANLTGITIPAGNVSNATVFGNYNYTFQGNISLLTTNKVCLNSGCTQWILGNATGIWIQG